MPMIDVYAATGTFPDTAQLAKNLAAAVMAVEEVPNIPMFRKNTAAFVHELPAPALANVDGDSTYVRVQVLTNAGALDREKRWRQLASGFRAVISEMKRVTWPSRKETLTTTAMVFVMVFIAAGFFFLIDQVFSVGVRLVFGLGH